MNYPYLVLTLKNRNTILYGALYSTLDFAPWKGTQALMLSHLYILNSKYKSQKSYIHRWWIYVCYLYKLSGKFKMYLKFELIFCIQVFKLLVLEMKNASFLIFFQHFLHFKFFYVSGLKWTNCLLMQGIAFINSSLASKATSYNSRKWSQSRNIRHAQEWYTTCQFS